METGLTSALIIRRSPGVAVCRPEKHTHMWVWLEGDRGARSGRDAAAGSGGRALLRWQTQIITKSLSCWALPTQRDRFSFPLLLPPLFFLPPSAAHNSEHYDGCPEALEWIRRAGQDSTPGALYVEYCTALNCLTVAEWKMPPPPLPLLRQEARVTQGFSLPFSLRLSRLPSFIFFLPLSLGYRSSPLV